MNALDISMLRLFIFYLFLLIPFGILVYLKGCLTKQIVFAVARMTVQLFLVGLYLGSLFALNSVWLNMLWLLLMIVVAAGHVVKSSGLKLRELFLPSFIAVLLSLLAILLPLLILVVRPQPFYDARYLIPLGGMLLGNFLSKNIISLQHFCGAILGNKQYIQTALCSGASIREAVLPFFREAFMRSLTPMVTTIATLGVISLPGMLTGQILGGSVPLVAIKYQIIIMIAILVSGSLSIFLTLYLVTEKIFDHTGNVRKELYR